MNTQNMDIGTGSVGCIAWLGHWWLWRRRGTIFDSRLAWVARGVEAGKKLDRGEKVNEAECKDALSWDKYCTGGTGGNVQWMLERWQKYQRDGLLPIGEWETQIQTYTVSMYDDASTMRFITRDRSELGE